jgi:hypothetical protein
MNPMSGLAKALSLLVGLVSLAASRNASAYDPPVDPCSLLTAEQVSAALGAKAAPGKKVVATLCEWDVAAQGSNKRLTVGFVSASAWEQTRALRESMKGVTRTPVPGLGEEAVYAVTPVANTLEVKKGSAVLGLHLYGFSAEESKAKEIALAKLALGKF